MSAEKRAFHVRAFSSADVHHCVPQDLEECYALLQLIPDSGIDWEAHKPHLKGYENGPDKHEYEDDFQKATIQEENAVLITNAVKLGKEAMALYTKARETQLDLLAQLHKGPIDPDTTPSDQCAELFVLLANFKSLDIRMMTIVRMFSLLKCCEWLIQGRIAKLTIVAYDTTIINDKWAVALEQVALTPSSSSSSYLPKCLRHMITAVCNHPATSFPLVLPNTAMWHTLHATGSTVRSTTHHTPRSTVRSANHNLSRSTTRTALTDTEQSALTAAVRPHLRDAITQAATGWTSPDYKNQLVLVLRQHGAAPVQLPAFQPLSPAVPTHTERSSAHALSHHLALIPRRTALQDATFSESLQHLTRAELLDLNKELAEKALHPDILAAYQPPPAPTPPASDDGSAPGGTMGDPTLRHDVNTLAAHVASVAETQAGFLTTLETIQTALRRQADAQKGIIATQQQELVVSQH